MLKNEYLKKRNALLAEAEAMVANNDFEGFEAKSKEIEALDTEFDNAIKMQANLEALRGNSQASLEQVQLNNNTPEVDDKFATAEYRKLFMNFCKTGNMPAEYVNVDEVTTSTDAGAVIPTTILQEVIRKMEVRGNLFAKVRKLAIQGGVEVPISAIKPVATWIGETSTSDRQKLDLSGNISFNYYGLECKIAQSLVVSVTTLQVFESTIIELITEAMLKALDIAIVKGTGTGQPTGLTVDARIPAANVITLSAANFVTWEGWKKEVFAKMPLAYRAGAEFTMAAGTWDGYIDGMVDANGQPMARTNYGIADATPSRFGGKDVTLVEDDVIAPYGTASTDDVVALYCKYSDYAINSNLQMTMYRWLDHDTNQWVDKAILIADGKIVDPNGVIIIKKGV